MDVGKLLGGLDLDDAKQAIDFVRDNRDDFDRLVQLLRDLPDDALSLLTQLPKLVRTIGDGLAEAGEQAGRAAQALVGDDGKGGARKALAGGAQTMSSAKEQLDRAAGLLGGVAKELNDIGIPKVEPTFTKVAGFNVVTGVDIGSSKPLEGPARKLSDGAATVSGVAGDLDSLSGTLRELSDILGTVGEALSGLGQRLAGSGGSVQGLLGKPG